MAVTTEVDTSIRLTTTEALLAVMVEHLEREVDTLRSVVGACSSPSTAGSRCDGDDLNDWTAYAMNSLYRDRTESGFRQAQLPPFPPHWLGTMARTGKSVAQVARSKADAAARMERALND